MKNIDLRLLGFIFMACLFSLVVCQCNNKKPAENSDKNIDSKKSESLQTQVVIPEKVKDYIKSNLAGWAIPDTSDYIKCWWSFYETDQIPFFVSTDLNGDILNDYALILKNKNSLRLVILMGSGNTFTYWIADNFNETYNTGKVKGIQFGVQIEQPRTIDVVVDNKEYSLELRTYGIALMALEQKCFIYYWEDGKIKVFKCKSSYKEFLMK